MNRTPIFPDLSQYPTAFHSLLRNAPLYDSSCSPEAQVVFVDRDGGYFLKSGEKAALATEAAMTRYFADKGLAAQVVEYLSADRDWLLTRRVPGEDCIFPAYLEHPERLCDTLATLLRRLHETDATACPVADRNAAYFVTADRNYRAGVFDPSFLCPELAHLGRDEAYAYILKNGHLMQREVLLHGDYCLPNIILQDFAFSGFIDLGGAGVGDRHIDLFWGAWTLCYNLKTNRYRQRFFDAYGRELVDRERLRLVSVMETFG